MTYNELACAVRRYLLLSQRALGWRERLRRKQANAALIKRMMASTTRAA